MQGKQIETMTLEELFSGSAEGSLPILLDIQHDDIVWTDPSYQQENGHLRLINSTTTVRYNGNKYLPCVFNYTIPTEDGQKIGNTNISISAIDRRIVELIRSISTKPRCVIDSFYTKISDYEFMFSKVNHFEFEMTSVSWDDTTAKWELTYDPAMQTNVPYDMGTATRFPAAKMEQ